MHRTGFCLLLMLLAGGAAAGADLIPLPASVTTGEGSCTLTASTLLYYDPAVPELQGYAERFAARLRLATGLPLPLQPLPADTSAADALYFTAHGARAEWGREGYSLEVTTAGGRIRANAAPGFFYGMQTLLQLLPPAVGSPTPVPGTAWRMESVTILDQPRFAWRGVHLDVGRHFFPVEFVKKYIDMIALYKMNTFHWHLTEDQGWRIEIKKYPRLMEVGAWRNDGISGPYGGFYTQEEVREIVAYAAERAITVVPEIEMPGHSLAALASYPRLGCTGGPYRVQFSWGVFDDVFCAGRDSTFTFLEDVLTEVMALFPGEYIHIGGDECPKTRWRSCPDCQARIKAEGLANESELQSWFVRRIERFLSANGRRLIGWDEILEGGIAPNATVMSWRGFDGGVEAARSGHDVVMAPREYCYLNFYQGVKSGEPAPYGDYLPIEKVYAFEPVPDVLTSAEAQHVIGAQACLWTEFITESRKAEYMLFPRLCALSEVVWNEPSRRDYADFSLRLQSHFERLEAADINVRIPPSAYFPGTGGDAGFEFRDAGPLSGLLPGGGARIGSDALLWEMTSDNLPSGAALTFTEPQDMRLRIPYYSLSFAYRTNLAPDTLFVGFRDEAGRGFYLQLLKRHIAATNTWVSVTRALSGFKSDPGFDASRVVRFGFWTNSSRSGARFQFADVYLGVPQLWPVAHSPILFFNGENFNPLFRIKGFENAAGSGVAGAAGMRPGSAALRWLPPADGSPSSVRWRFNETIDLSGVLGADTLKFALKAPAGCDSLQIAFTDAGQRACSLWLTRTEGFFDGQWRTLQLPLTRFTADPDFSAQAVDLFSFFIRSHQPGEELLLSDIWIGQPPASAISGIEERAVTPAGYSLEQNYPNPFNPLTTIAYHLAERGRVRLTIHNLLGQQITTLIDGVEEGGSHQLYWDASRFASGLYYCRLEVNGFVRTRKMVLVK